VLRRLFLLIRIAILFTVALILLSIYASAQPALTLSISTGPPTTKLLASGNGYDPYSAVDIYFDTKDEALAVTDGSGSFGQIGITVPGSAKPGGHWVTGVERYTGLAGQSRFLVNTNWAEFHFSPDLDGLNPYENVLSPSNVSRLANRWTNHGGIRHATSSSPAIVNGIVYVGFDYYLFALSANTGRVLWKYKTGYFVGSSPAVANGIVYVGSDDTNLYALNANTGALLWKYSTGGYVTDPVVVDGVVYVACDIDYVFALNAANGNLLWEYKTRYVVLSSPAVANGVVYIGSEDGNFYALDAANGSVLWTYATNAVIVSSAAVVNGTVYFGSDDETVHALNAATGSLLWQYKTDGYVRPTPAVANGTVYVGSDDDTFYALNAATGNLLWKYTT